MPKATKKKSAKKLAASRTKTARSKKIVRRKKVTPSKRRRVPNVRNSGDKLTRAAVAIGSVLGKADSAAHKVASVVKEEAVAISDQVKDALS